MERVRLLRQVHNSVTSLLSGVKRVDLGKGVTLRVLVMYAFSRLHGFENIRCAIDSISTMDDSVLSIPSDIALTGLPMTEDDYIAVIHSMDAMIKALPNRRRR